MKTLTQKHIRQIAKERRVIFFLDYDGTLAAIHRNPAKGKLKASEKKIFQQLLRQKGITVALISGRSNQSLKQMVRLPGLIYAGNHGFELEGLRMKRVHPAAAAAKTLLRRIANNLEKRFRAVPGILIENKTYTLTVHYRDVRSEQIQTARLILLKETRFWLAKSKIVLCDGKKVWEIHPAAEWNKGTTVLWLFSRIFAEQPGHILPVYIGDDLPDEDAFKALGNRGVTIKVTGNSKERSHARFRLRSPSEVFKFLTQLIKLRKAYFINGNMK